MRQLKITKQITKRESQSLEKYLQEIGSIPLLTAEQEVEIAKRIKKKDKEALKKLQDTELAKRERAKENYELKVNQLQEKILAKQREFIKTHEKAIKKFQKETLTQRQSLKKGNKESVNQFEKKKASELNRLIEAHKKDIGKLKKKEASKLKRFEKEYEDLIKKLREAEVNKCNRMRGEYEGALNTLIEANLRFVVSVAKQYQNQGLPLSDLINIGNFGLIKAAKRFDYTRGFKFISYAVWWVRQCILQALPEESRVVRIPLNRAGCLNKIHKNIARLEQEYERKPTIDELSEEMGMAASEIRHTLQVSGRHVSLNTPFVEGEDNSLLDVLKDEQEEAPEKSLIDESLEKEVRKLILGLNPRQREVITLYFGIGRPFPMTLEEIGKQLNLTRERVRQIKEKILVNLRNQAHYKNLKSYLGGS